MGLEDCRSALGGSSLWRALGLPEADKVSALDGGKKEVKICSPFRADNSPSFSVTLNPDGTICGKDWSSGESFNDFGLIAQVKGISKGEKKELLKAYHELAGVDWEDGGRVFKNKKAPPKQAPKEVEKPKVQQTVQVGEIKNQGMEKQKPEQAGGTKNLVRAYDYTDEEGRVLHQTLRYEPKTFRQRRVAMPGEAGDAEGWVYKLTGGRLVPFHLARMASAPGAVVLMVEGEKDAETVQGLLDGVDVAGVVVTTLPMGCGKWRDEYAKYFKGRQVIVLADFDAPREDGSAAGFDGALKVCEVLRDVAGRVGLLELPQLWHDAAFGTDVSDWVETRREFGVNDDDLAEQLVKAVMGARLPRGLVYDGIVARGSRGGLVVDEDMLAQRLVADERLLFSAAAFWRYDGVGLWKKEVTTLEIEKMIREALRVAGGGELITNARVKSILGLAKSVRHCAVERMNAQPAGMVCVDNGMLDTRNGELVEHRQGYLMNTRVPHKWAPGAVCPEWLAWLEERHPDIETRECLQEMFGYCLAVDINYHVFFFLYGDGGTGKSTCVSVLEELVGEGNRVSIQLEELDNAFMRSQLAGKSLYLCKELTTKSFAHIGLIKAIVSGDPIPVDVKYAQPYDFRPFGRMVMESNVIATTPDSSGGFSRRFVQIDWERPIAREDMDFNLLDKFRAEMPGIMVWAMEGLARLRERGHFKLTKKSEESRDQLLRHRSQVASFVASGAVIEQADLHVPVARVYKVYEDWCEEHDVVPFYKEQSSFMRELMSKQPEWRDKKRRIRSDIGDREWIFEGLGLAPETDGPDPF
jgi:P4 family phage/plasmid primase-like protien